MKRLTNSSLRESILRWVVAACWVYLTFFALWLLLYLLTGDAIGWVGLVSALAVYLFLPLPVVAFVAWRTSRRELWAGVLVGVVCFMSIWGVDFLPKFPRASEKITLRVLTYNVLGLEKTSTPMLEVLRNANADIVCLQELTPELAADIRTQLQGKYPFQYLEPADIVFGAGVLSKVALTPQVHSLGQGWIGRPQALRGVFDEHRFLLVNFHMPAFNLQNIRTINQGFRVREDLARALGRYVQAQGLPAIVCGDANSAPLSTAYRILRQSGLQDSWREAGWGFGHTFPGSARPGSSRPRIFGIAMPMWSTRIDYVLHTPEWQAIQVQTAPFDGVSDHRGVLATLVWRH